MMQPQVNPQTQTTHAPETINALLDVVIATNQPDVLNYKQDGHWQSISAHEIAAQVRATTLGLYSLGVRRAAVRKSSRMDDCRFGRVELRLR
jgi:long-subunit acyl-CoA synthetase (AMP-forming)